MSSSKKRRTDQTINRERQGGRAEKAKGEERERERGEHN